MLKTQFLCFLTVKTAKNQKITLFQPAKYLIKNYFAGQVLSSNFKLLVTLKTRLHTSRGFNGSVNIPESCDFRSQSDPLNIIC